MRLLARLGLLSLTAFSGSSGLLRAQTPLHVFHGDSAGDEFGVSVALVGDANRDGYADILAGAHWDDNNGSKSGSARLFSGLDGSVLSTVFGDAANDFFGLAVADLGDVNGDGYDDFAVGADGSDFGGLDSGLVRVFSGKTSAVLRNITGSVAGEQLGDAIAGVRDASHAVLIGAPSSNAAGVDAGLARVVSTANGATLWTFYGAVAGDQFGTAVASGMDINGDSIPDFLIGAPNDDVGGIDSGSVSAYSGSTGNLIRTLHGYAAGDRFGTSVALIPDADGDGRADVVIGAPRANGPGTDAGAVYVLSGGSGSLFFSRAGEASGDQFGSFVANVSTRTGNPEPLFAVGARLNDVGGNNAGASYVYSALSGGLVQVLRGHAPGDWFGGVVAGGADVNGDGLGDLVVSARLADVNGSDSGSVEVHSSPLIPSTWYVDAAAPGPGEGTQAIPYRSIQYAINRPSTRSGDTVLVQPGTYFENLDFVGKSIGLIGNGTASQVILDGQHAGSCVSVSSGEGRPTQVANLKIINGNGSNFGEGGGIDFRDSPVLVHDCSFQDNSTDYGGAISGTRVSIANCLFTGNGLESFTRGGAVYGGGEITGCTFIGNRGFEGGAIYGDFVITGCALNSNFVWDGFGGAFYGHGQISSSTFLWSNCGVDGSDGGGLYLDGPTTVDDCYIAHNNCSDGYAGGGIYASVPAIVVRRCVLEANASAYGGGAFGGSYYDCVFKQNRTGSDWSNVPSGGGLHSAYAERCTFVSNEANVGTGLSGSPGPGQGGAGCSSILVNCTMVDNVALGFPGWDGDGGGALDCTLINCIAWDNLPNQVAGTSTARFSAVQGGFPGTGNISSDPLFLVPNYNFHLTSLSPCIDAGDPTSPLDPDSSRADMGAFPYDPNYCPPPFVYCTAKTNSCGQLPVISFAGAPHAGASSGFVITTTGARAGRSGLLLYSPNGSASTPFQGGTLCVASQGVRRGIPVLATGGSGGVLCDSLFAIDWAAYASGSLGGNPQPFLNTLGQRVNVQWWGRDNLIIGSLLSAAIQYEVCP